MPNFSDPLTAASPSALGAPWEVVAGTLQKDSNGAYSPDGSSPAIGVVDSGATNFEVEALIGTYAQFEGLTFSWVNSSNYGRLILSSIGKYELQVIVGGTEVVNLQWGVLEPVSGDVVKVRRNGSELKGYVNGVERFSTTTTALASSTKHGMFKFGQSAGRTRNFSITDLGGGGGGAATAVTMTGPSSGTAGSPSSNFTIGANGAITGTVTVTPSDGGAGGTFAPTSVNISSGTPTATFTYTAASAGARTISVTNNGGLANPSNITYTASAPAATSMTIALKQSDGTTAAASITGIEYAILNAPTLGAATAIVDTGTGESTDVSGNLVLDITGLGLTVGQVRYVVAGKSNGTVGSNFDGWHGPATAA